MGTVVIESPDGHKCITREREYLSGGDVPLPGYFISPISSRTGYQIDRSGWLFSPILCLRLYFEPIFSGIGYHLKAKNLEPGKRFSSWAHPHINLGQVPPCKFFTLSHW